jgi:hypothetical protein
MVDVKQISRLVRKHFKISNKGTFEVNPQNGEVDVVGNVTFKGAEASQGQFHVQFGTVQGDFACYEKGVTSLKGSPHTIHGDFFCFGNLLKDLVGAPRVVHGGFSCMANQLTSLKGAPEKVGDWFACDNNQLTSLQGAPRWVGGSFICASNKLTSLEGGPAQVMDRYNCRLNPLKSFEGAPERVGHLFECDYKKDLPLLRLITLQAKKLDMMAAPKPVWTILNKYKGTQNPADILRCASELNEAGFEGNAEW